MPHPPHPVRDTARRETAPTGPAARPIGEKDVHVYRLVSGLAAVAVIAFGFVYRAALPGAVDPWAYRLVVAGACLGVAALSFVRGGAWLLRALYALFVLITAWVALLLALNSFAPEYALGMVVIVAVICVLFPSIRALAAYAAVTLAMVTAVAARVESPRFSPLLFGCYLLVILGLLFVVVRNRLRAEREVAASEERYALAARGAHDGLWDWDVRSGTVYYSPRWKEILGYGGEAVGAGPEEWLDRVHPGDRARVDAELAAHGDAADANFELEHRMAHRDGTWRSVLVRGVRLRGGDGAVVRMAGSLTDISRRKAVEEQLLHDAMHDALTGLPNRGLFLDRLERAIAYARRHKDYRFAVVFLDLDRFKVVNDRVGHLGADEVLVEVARRLERCLRAEDSVARLGGDEFALLLHDVADPAPLAQRIQHELALPFRVDGHELALAASLGVALSATGYARTEDVLRDADAAMYRAKARGRARFEVADAELHARALEQVELEGELRQAVPGGQLRLHFQPVVLLETGAPVGFEALVRWQHPVRGLRLPDEFIPLAEQTGMITAIGAWVLREGCRQMQAWRRAHPRGEALWLSVNLSSRQFLHPGLAQEIADVLRDTGFPPARLRLEITESVIMDDPAGAVLILQRLRATGISVAVDDFGTGYSSLSYLHRLPLDTLKIDRSFVHRMDSDPTLEAVIQTVISLSGSLNLDTVAEGVESHEEARALRRMGCRFGQGYLFSHPLPPEAAERLVAALGPAAAP